MNTSILSDCPWVVPCENAHGGLRRTSEAVIISQKPHIPSPTCKNTPHMHTNHVHGCGDDDALCREREHTMHKKGLQNRPPTHAESRPFSLVTSLVPIPISAENGSGHETRMSHDRSEAA